MSGAKEVSEAASFLTELLASGDKAVLLDSGGFVWWTHEDGEGRWLAGVAEPKRSGQIGTAIEAWMNLMSPQRAAAFGPFTLIHREAAE